MCQSLSGRKMGQLLDGRGGSAALGKGTNGFQSRDILLKCGYAAQPATRLHPYNQALDLYGTDQLSRLFEEVKLTLINEV